MSESLGRLLGNMIASIDQNILPHLTDDFARGQAYGLIYMLRCLSRQTSWSRESFIEQIDALETVSAAFQSQLAAGGARPSLPAFESAWRGLNAEALEQLRNAATSRICAVYDWFDSHRADLPIAEADRIDAAYNIFLARLTKVELERGVPINFSEISTGLAAAK